MHAARSTWLAPTTRRDRNVLWTTDAPLRQRQTGRQLSPIAVGTLFALASATAFGLTLPLLSWAGRGVGPFATAALLYLGASVSALAQRAVTKETGAPLTRRELPPLLLMAFAGAAVAPIALSWGLAQTGPVTGGLLLNLEAVWSVLLASLVFREFLGRRVIIALVLMGTGGAALFLGNDGTAAWSSAGVLAIIVATVGWAIDNTASRRLSEMRPLVVVASKGALGALLTGALSLVTPEGLPLDWRVPVLLLAGASGYGLSLRLYLLAQRRIGAARTASVFSLAPFIGAGLGLVVEPERLTWNLGLAAVLFAMGVAVHASEGHEHRHRHDAVTHEHTHRHDDGHHTHDVAGAAEHSHLHTHSPLDHAHAHGEDVHHRHVH